jgi:glycosyltransferase involved in cell wall biosynthesis
LKESIKRLHICLLTSSRVFEIGYGGDSRFSGALGNFLASQGHDVTLIAAAGFVGVKSKQLSRNYTGGGVGKTELSTKKVKVLNPPYALYALSRLFISFQWILKILFTNRKHPINVIHAQDTGYSGLAAIISGKILGIPVIISSLGIRHKIIETYISGTLKDLLLRIEYNLDIFTTKKAGKVIVVNPAIKEYFESRTSRKIDFMPIPIKVKEFGFSEASRETIRQELGIDRKAIVIGFVGRLEPVKNLGTLLIAFANVAGSEPSIKMVFVGTGQLESKLRESAKARGVEDKVIFCGVRYDIARVLACFDIFVLPSYTEGMSTALLEAMASGRAVICSNIPSNCEVVNDSGAALIFDPHSTIELEKCIRLLCNDELLRCRMGIRARNIAEKYDENMVFPEILRLYEELIREY